MKTLVTGSTGLLGRAIMNAFQSKGLEIIGLARRGAELECDLTDQVRLREAFAAVRPGVVINAAAIVDHAACEAEPGRAYAVNARAVSLLAELCRESGAYLMQISTDHYFCGQGDLKHDENAPVTLLNEYARTKYAGEAFALTSPEACVIRTNVVGFRGWEKPTFVEWVVGTLGRGESLTAFDDYHTSSIDAGSLAALLLKIAELKPRGILNVAAGQVFSKDQFIRALAARLGLDEALISTGGLKGSSLTPRRADSLGLDVARAENILAKMPGLAAVVENLAAEYFKGSV